MSLQSKPTISSDKPAPTVVVMAKPAIPGQVKTRLINPSATAGPNEGVNAQQAAEVHRALLECTLSRVSCLAAAPDHRVLAMDGGVVNPPAGLEMAACTDWRVIDQGRGDLGQRLDHVWRAIGGGPVIFLGVDSPDLPKEDLGYARATLGDHDLALGPSDDGGYWTLACRTYRPVLLRNIDWGGPNVYDQTVQAANDAGLSLTALRRWDDVDSPADLAGLQRRLADSREPELVRLRTRLGECLGLAEVGPGH